MIAAAHEVPAYVEHFNRERPEIFYKFFPVEEWLPKLLSGESLRFSSRATFNDPFDCHPSLRLREDKEAISYFQSKLRGLPISPSQRLLRAIEGVRTVKADPRVISDHLKELLDEIGVLCLAEGWDHPLMWAHYARSHQGIAVGFHSRVEVFQLAQPVIYSKVLPTVRIPVDIGLQLFFDVFQNKAECWHYEREWRIVKPPLSILQQEEQYRELVCHTTVAEARSLSNQRGAGIYPFPKAAIADITLGMQISQHDAQSVIKALRQADLDIPIYKIAASDHYLLKRVLIK